MKLAVLVCDYVNDDLEPIFGDIHSMFYRALLPVISCSISPFLVYRDEVFPNVDDYDIFIISGSRCSANDSLTWIEHLLMFTKEAVYKNKKVIGFCFGHQIIAKAIGAMVDQGERSWNLGVQKVEVLQYSYGDDSESSLYALFNHSEYVTNLPKVAELLAGSKKCPVQMFKYNNSIGFQGHPEYEVLYQEAIMKCPDSIEQWQRDEAIANNRQFSATNYEVFNYIFSRLGIV